MKKGFTILELLVVISVLVILIGIAIPRFKGMQDAGRVAQAKTELQTMQTAIESYYINQTSNPKAYPPTSTTVGGVYLGPSVPQIVPLVPPYDPFAAASTEYKYVLNSPYYVIGSVGAANVSLTTLAVNSTTGAVTLPTNALCVSNGTGC